MTETPNRAGWRGLEFLVFEFQICLVIGA
jgi:hypothetical protein